MVRWNVEDVAFCIFVDMDDVVVDGGDVIVDDVWERLVRGGEGVDVVLCRRVSPALQSVTTPIVLWSRLQPDGTQR